MSKSAQEQVVGLRNGNAPDKVGSAVADPAYGFQGELGKTLAQSTPWWKPRQAPAPGAPNIVVILLDDVGFSDFGCYGSEIRTPHIDALAADGLRFSQYTTVPMCTPARAALMTGKNPHSVGCGWLTHNNPGYPGYQAGEISKDAPTMPELLRQAGYSTYGVGKWHNTADTNNSPSANKDAWPLQRGFDQYYGFLGAETNFFAPGQLIDGNTFIDCDGYREDYYSTDDWTEKSLAYLKSHIGATPDKPFFLYVAHNAPHVPLHAKPQDVDRYAGVYACGWDAIRTERFARQQATGLVPPDWQLSERAPDIPAWDSLTREDQELYAHYMALYAAMLDCADQSVGRLVAFLKESGQFENTLFIVTSDNGATAIGGPKGAANIFEKRVGGTEASDAAANMLRQGELGGPRSYAVYPVGWGNACNTPFRYYKRTPMNGGIRVPFVMHWPKGIAQAGEIRREWIHVTDTLPTLLKILGTPYPEVFNGLRTRGLDGFSYQAMLRSGSAASMRDHQHYELEGNRGYISGHWKIVSLQAPGKMIDLDNWMLFDLASDPTEGRDLAHDHPVKLRELIQAFEADAQANYVYPIDNRDHRRVLAIPPFMEPTLSVPRMFYPGCSTVPATVMTALLSDRNFDIECDFDFRPADRGVLFAVGNSFGGMTLFVDRGCVHFVYNGGTRISSVDGILLSEGAVQVVLRHRATGQRRGEGTLSVNEQAASAPIDMSPTILRLTGEGLDVGRDRRLKVCDRYHDEGAFAYSGTIRHVRLQPGARAPDSISNKPERQAQLD
jgi:arylsulfatase A-like enzyme